MDADEIRQQVEVRNAVADTFANFGMRFCCQDGPEQIVSKLRDLGVTATIGPLGLELKQGQTEMSLSKACATLRQQNAALFSSDVRFDAISSKEDFHGSPQEIAQAKSAWISKHGAASFAALPTTRADAELRSVAPSANMTRKQWLALPFSERARLSAVLGPDALGRIIARKQ